MFRPGASYLANGTDRRLCVFEEKYGFHKSASRSILNQIEEIPDTRNTFLMNRDHLNKSSGQRRVFYDIHGNVEERKQLEERPMA